MRYYIYRSTAFLNAYYKLMIKIREFFQKWKAYQQLFFYHFLDYLVVFEYFILFFFVIKILNKNKEMYRLAF